MKNQIKNHVLFIVGPTASGKTNLAIKIAKKYNGEIICADSRTIYKYMDVATAKPSKKQQSEVPHWGIDLVNPGKYYTALDFKKYCLDKINEIKQRGGLPIVVGGTGLYMDAVLFDYDFGAKPDKEKRLKLQHLSIEELQEYCSKNNINLPENTKNKRYLIRAIENNGIKQNEFKEPAKGYIIVGITTNKNSLINNIEARIDEMLTHGLIEEAENLGGKFGWDSEAMKANAYPLIKDYLGNEINITDVKNTLIHLDWKLAKKQTTWFKRNPFINWFTLDKIEKAIDEAIANCE